MPNFNSKMAYMICFGWKFAITHLKVFGVGKNAHASKACIIAYTKKMIIFYWSTIMVGSGGEF